MLFYPLTDKRHAVLVKEIQERRANGTGSAKATSKAGAAIGQAATEIA